MSGRILLTGYYPERHSCLFQAFYNNYVEFYWYVVLRPVLKKRFQRQLRFIWPMKTFW